MKKLAIAAVLAAALTLSAQDSASERSLLSKTELRQALKAHDRAVHIHDHWIRDPFIYLNDDGYYYLTGTTLKSEDDGVIGIPAWRSENLITWEKLPRLWKMTDSSWLPEKHGGRHNVPETLVWAPEFYKIGNRWVITHTTNAGVANLLVNDSPELKGPWTEPMAADFGKHHDPAFYIEDGKPWLVWGVLDLREMKPDFSGWAGPQISLAPSDRKMGHEGSYIIKIGQKYVWFGTAWSTDTMRHGTYNLYYATSDSLTGPYGERRFAGRFLGHGTPFQDKQGRWWCTEFYNANKPTVPADKAASMDLSDTAYTINPIGTTIVPLEIEERDGDVFVRAKDPHYANPGPEEVQQF
ncbi:family 43 glycosylhydrolase [Pelagicoccus sp. NFK12]|uniref:Family 43 glycosylhydrolase n=1 Tax=Pelagicoccus enzymogenes TaxID=2773457 RepID=A0A927F4X1_9BACT|nr:family 43 glycosylhydrolase [Pelagicoccus enzymogenes]MBD5777949.1 family 43 glycosylhydrolase [Pelagicoccus enzymogenes]